MIGKIDNDIRQEILEKKLHGIHEGGVGDDHKNNRRLSISRKRNPH